MSLPPSAVIPDEDLLDGFSAEEICNVRPYDQESSGFTGMSLSSLTFDDLIALPGSIDFGVNEVNLSTRGDYCYWIIMF